MRKTYLAISIIILSSISLAYGVHKEIGSLGDPLLSIAPDARTTAMGGAFCAVGDESNSVFYNPAGLGSLRHTELAFSKNYWFENNNHYYAALAYNLHDIRASNISELGTLYFGYTFLDASAFPLSASGAAQFNPKDQLYFAGYGKPVYENDEAGAIMAGVSVKFFNEEAGAVKSDGQAFDAGVLWDMPGKTFSAGLAAQNLGDKISHSGGKFDLPSNLRAGIASRMLDERILLSADAKLPQSGDSVFNVGTELWFLHSVALRAGYTSKPGAGASGISAGLGLSLRQLDIPFMYAHAFNVDYSFIPYGDKGNVHRLSVLMKLGAE